MMNGIVDTTVIIHRFRGDPAAKQWIDSLQTRLAITPITWLEVIQGAQSKARQAACRTILGQFDMLYLTSADQDWAMQQMEQYRLSHGVSINDCLIAAVAYRVQVPLYTHNLKHMQALLGTTLPQQPY